MTTMRKGAMTTGSIAAPGLGALIAGPFPAKERDIVLAVTIPGDPLSKQRPRWERRTGHMYTPASTRHREESIRTLAKLSHRELVMDTTALFSLRAGFHLATNQRRDADNMLKLVADALTGLVWADDSQVAEMFAYKVHADPPTDARTEIVVARVPGVIAALFATCMVCRRQFRTYPSWPHRAFCSRLCSALAQRQRVSRPCDGCGVVMERPRYNANPGGHIYCSQECRARHATVTLTCTACGKLFTVPRSIARKRRRCSITCVGRGPGGRLTPRPLPQEVLPL